MQEAVGTQNHLTAMKQIMSKTAVSDAGAEASGFGNPADSSDKGDKGVSDSDADAEASGSESEGEGAESENLPSIPNKLPESDIPAIAIRVLFNKRLRGLKRELEDILQEFNRDKYAEIERRQAEKKGSRAEKKCRRQQRKYPRVQAQAYLALIAPDGRVEVSMSKETEEHPQLMKATEAAHNITCANGGRSTA